MRKILLGFLFLGFASQAIVAQTLPNMDLEQWTNHTYYDQPAGGVWATANAIVDLLPAVIPPTTTKSTDAHGGQYSAKMESKIWPVANILMSGTLATGVFNNQSSTTGNALKRGTPYTARPTTFSGWYKYTSVAQDSCILYAWLTKWNGSARDTVGIALMKEYNTVSTWTEFVLPFVYHSNDTPDSISSVFTSSANGENLQGQAGSSLWVDDLALTTATGLQEVWMPENHVAIGPNPAHDNVHFHFEKAVKEGDIQLFDASGKIVKVISVKGQDLDVHVSDLASGSYHLLLKEKGTATYSGKFIKQ